MKKIILLLVLPFVPLLMNAQISSNVQEKNTFLQLSLGAGYNSLKFDFKDGSTKGGIGETFQATYHYRFRNSFGLKAGLGMINYLAISESNSKYSTNRIDDDGVLYNLRYKFNNLKEVSSVRYLEIPLMVEYYLDLGKESELVVGLGLKALIPVYSNYRVKHGTQTISGYYPEDNILFEDLPDNGFPTDQKISYRGNIDMRPSSAASLEIGAYFKDILPKSDLYAGAYCDYGLGKNSDIKDQPLVENSKTYNGVINSSLRGDLSTFAIGLKVGVRFGLSSRGTNEAVAELNNLDRQLIELKENAVSQESMVEKLKEINSRQQDEINKLSSKVQIIENDPAIGRVSSVLSKEKQEIKSIEESLIFFNRNSDQIIEPSKEKIKKIFDFLEQNKNYNIFICGYSSSEGTEDYNITLSEKRALAIQKVLLDKGIEANRIFTIARGSSDSIVPNDNEENRGINRRVQVRIMKVK